ncbi:MAG: hypothetical protein IIC18_09895, partial [Bacteroidetes bacterium]|nr:hypothetical protein [Bacteroidota bacterium]
MRARFLLAIALLIGGASAFALFILVLDNPQTEEKYEPGAMEPTDWFYRQRAFPFGEINHDAVREAHEQAA